MLGSFNSPTAIRALVFLNSLAVVGEALAAFFLVFAMSFVGIFPAVDVIVAIFGAVFAMIHLIWLTRIGRRAFDRKDLVVTPLLIALGAGLLVLSFVFARIS